MADDVGRHCQPAPLVAVFTRKKEPVGSDVEGAAVITPTAVASILVCENGTKVLAGRTENEDLRDR